MKRRILLTLAFMGLFLGIFQLGTMVPLPDEISDAIYEQLHELIADLQASGDMGASIGFHNLGIALTMFIPGVGVLVGMGVAGMTGIAVSAISDNIMLDMPPILLLLVTPFGLMELVAYGIAMSRALIMALFVFYLWVARRENMIEWGEMRTYNPVWHMCIEIGIVVGLLMVAGYIEHEMIQMAGGIDLEGLM